MVPSSIYLDVKVNDISLEILDAKGMVVRKFSSLDTLYKIPDVNIPLYWITPKQLLSAEAGSHRFVWDMHYAPLNVPASYPISAVYKTRHQYNFYLGNARNLYGKIDS